jgi:hypothetical protein
LLCFQMHLYRYTVEHKMGRVMNNLVCVEAKYSVDALLVGGGGGKGKGGGGGGGGSLCEVAERLVECEAERIMAGEVLIGGDLRHPDDQMASIASTSVRAELLCPLRSSAVVGAAHNLASSSSSSSKRWEARVRGVVSARAYAYSRETAGRAAADLKADVVASLRARLDLLIDEAEREADEADAEAEEDKQQQRHPLAEGAAPPSGAPVAFALPRRAWVRWVDGCAVCDYLVRRGKPRLGCPFESVMSR